MSKENKTFDLEERLIDFAVRIIRIAESLPTTALGKHISGQLIRCGTSPAPNYGEAQSAESRSDFIHKLQIVLKELRESSFWLRLIRKVNLIPSTDTKLKTLLQEAEELTNIIAKSIVTAKRK